MRLNPYSHVRDTGASASPVLPPATGGGPAIEPSRSLASPAAQNGLRTPSLEGSMLRVECVSAVGKTDCSQISPPDDSGAGGQTVSGLGSAASAPVSSLLVNSLLQGSCRRNTAAPTELLHGQHRDPKEAVGRMPVGEVPEGDLYRPSGDEVLRPVASCARDTGAQDACRPAEREPVPLSPQGETASPVSSGFDLNNAYVTNQYEDAPVDVRACQYKFKIIRELGGGGFGKVYQAMLGDGRLVAVKKMKITSHDKVIDREIRVLSMLPPHKHCVRYLDTRKSNNHYYIFMEYVSGGSIHYIRKNTGAFEEPAMQRCVRMVLEGLQHIHKHNIVHRDIKGENVLLDEKGCVKIVDFGASRVLNGGNTTVGGVGTPYWMSPEVCRGEVATEKSDVWGVGCLCLEMTNSSGIPWSFSSTSNNTNAILYSIGGAKTPPQIPEHLSSAARDFIACALKIDPRDRPTVGELLQHPFFSQTYPAALALKSGSAISRVESLDFVNCHSAVASYPWRAAEASKEPSVAHAKPVAIGGGGNMVEGGGDEWQSRSPAFELNAVSSDDEDEYRGERAFVKPPGDLVHHSPLGIQGGEGVIGRVRKATARTPSHPRKGEARDTPVAVLANQPRTGGVSSPADVRGSLLPNASATSPERVVRAPASSRQRRSTETSYPPSTHGSSSITAGGPNTDATPTNPLGESVAKRKKNGESGKPVSEQGPSEGRPNKDNLARSNTFGWWRPKQGSEKTVIKWLIK